jgi:hypothetical protein
MCEAQATCESDSPNFSSHKAVKPLGFTFLRFSEAIGRSSFSSINIFEYLNFFFVLCKTFGLFKTKTFKFLIVFSQKRGWFRSTGRGGVNYAAKVTIIVKLDLV